MRAKLQNLRIWVAGAVLTLSSHLAWAGPADREPGDPRQLLLGGIAMLLLILWLLVAKVALVAFNLCAAELAPRLFRRGRAVLVASPVKSFFVGLVNVILLLIVGLVLVQHKASGILGVLLLIALLLVLFASRTLVYQLIGTRLVGEVCDPEGSPSPRAHCWGGAVIELAFLTPIIGQLAAIVVTVQTAGALILAAMSRERAAAPMSNTPMQ